MKQHFTGWRKSRHSEPNGGCIEVGSANDGTVGVRDTKQQGHGPTLEFTPTEWATFLGHVRNLPPEEVDPHPMRYTDWRKSRHSNPESSCIEAGRAADGTIGVRDTKQHGNGPILELSRAEWAAFLSHVRNLRTKR
jgi:hypothetical protein